jgi:phosphinothricin acetyltransferase
MAAAAGAMSDFNIREVTPADVPDLVAMSDVLGVFHGETTHANPASLMRALFAAPPWMWGLIAHSGPQPVGYAMMLPTA